MGVPDTIHAAALVGLPMAVAAATFAATWRTRTVVSVRTPRRTGTTRVARLRAPAAIRKAIEHRTSLRGADRLADDLPDVVELMVVAASSGCNVRLAVEAAVRHHAGPATEVFNGALREVALGARLSDALEDVIQDLDRRIAEVLRPVVAVLVDCDHYGTPAATALQRLSDDLRLHRQRRAETRARRIPVRLLLPLVLCVLPSFALLTVAPLFAGMARDALADHSNLPFEGEIHDP